MVGETWARAHGHEQFSWASTRAVSARRCVQVLSGSQSLLNLVVPQTVFSCRGSYGVDKGALTSVPPR